MNKQIKKWQKKFDDKFLWEVRPVGVRKGDKEQEEYVLGLSVLDWADDTTLGDIKDFLAQAIQESVVEAIKSFRQSDIEVNMVGGTEHNEYDSGYEYGYNKRNSEINEKIDKLTK